MKNSLKQPADKAIIDKNSLKQLVDKAIIDKNLNELRTCKHDQQYALRTVQRNEKKSYLGIFVE